MSFRVLRAMRGAAVSAALLTLLAACGEAPPPETPADQPPRASLTRVSFQDLPGFPADRVEEALPALKLSCARMTQRGAFPSAPSGLTEDSAPLFPAAEAWKAACARIAAVPDGDAAAARRVLTASFAPYLVTAAGAAGDGAATGTFTGYYEAELAASRTRGGAYQTPVYGVPDDLVSVRLADFDGSLPATTLVGRVEDQRLVRYWDRAQIEGGAVEGRAPVVLWAADPVDLHVLHIQGSGRVQLADGSTTRVGYAGNNGHRFVGIGKVMLDRGLAEPGKASMQDIRAWLKANRDQADSVMQANPRYIFFREITGPGPIGAQGVPLTPRRSMAVDPRFIAYGTPLWLDSVDPDGRPLQRLMVAQDTGSAIRGVVRGDFFWGTGEAALEHAGRMKSAGRYYVLLPL